MGRRERGDLLEQASSTTVSLCHLAAACGSVAMSLHSGCQGVYKSFSSSGALGLSADQPIVWTSPHAVWRQVPSRCWVSGRSCEHVSLQLLLPKLAVRDAKVPPPKSYNPSARPTPLDPAPQLKCVIAYSLTGQACHSSVLYPVRVHASTCLTLRWPRDARCQALTHTACSASSGQHTGHDPVYV